MAIKTLCLSVCLAFRFACCAQQLPDPARPIEVAVFLSVDCPISQKYVAKLNEIYAVYGNNPGLQWKFIVPERIGKKELRTFIADYDVRFPLQRDDGNKSMTSSFKARVTPQAIIRDTEILYSGAIDNWFYALGQYRQVITENYLTDALDLVLKGQLPTVKNTEAVGCPIAMTGRT